MSEKQKCHCEGGCPLTDEPREVCLYLHEIQEKLKTQGETDKKGAIEKFEQIGDICAVYGLRIMTRVHGPTNTLSAVSKIVHDVIVEDHKEPEAIAELFLHALKEASVRTAERTARAPIQPGEKVH